MNKYFFVHIEKTAGTSLKEMLMTNFNDADIYANKEDQKNNGWKYPPLSEYFNIDEEKIKKTQLFVGHVPWVFSELISKVNQKVITFTILRDPVQRILSHINYIKFYLSQRHQEYSKYENLSILEIYEKLGKNMANRQVRYFADSSLIEPLFFNQQRPLTHSAFEIAIKNFQKLTFFGITERFNESIQLINSFNTGITLNTPMFFNKTPQKDPHKPELIKKISEDNSFDIEFYDTAVEFFNSMLEEKNI